MLNKSNGFSLIEVLIALVILSIALTAIIKSSSQNIRNTIYLQNKTIASWVATQAINEARAGLVQFPTAPDHLDKDTTLLGRTWSWQGQLATTPNPHIKKIKVDVFEKASQSKLIHLESFIYENNITR